MNAQIDTLLKKFDGNFSAMARHFGVSPQAARKWVENGKIPLARIYEASVITGYPVDSFIPRTKPPITSSRYSSKTKIEVNDNKETLTNSAP